MGAVRIVLVLGHQCPAGQRDSDFMYAVLHLGRMIPKVGG